MSGDQIHEPSNIAVTEYYLQLMIDQTTAVDEDFEILKFRNHDYTMHVVYLFYVESKDAEPEFRPIPFDIDSDE